MSEDHCHTILLLEDDQATLNALRRELQDMDAKLITTTDVHEALQILKQRSVSLIISDECMPLWNGCRFLTPAEVSPATVRELITGPTDVDVMRKGGRDPAVFAESCADAAENRPRNTDMGLSRSPDRGQV